MSGLVRAVGRACVSVVRIELDTCARNISSSRACGDCPREGANATAPFERWTRARCCCYSCPVQNEPGLELALQIQCEAGSARFPVPDILASLAFYRDQLGFQLRWIRGEPAMQANVTLGGIDVGLSRSEGIDAAPAGNAYVQVDDVNAYHSELRGRGVAVGDVADRPYGMRDFEVIDPYGNCLVFGAPL